MERKKSASVREILTPKSAVRESALAFKRDNREFGRVLDKENAIFSFSSAASFISAYEREGQGHFSVLHSFRGQGCRIFIDGNEKGEIISRLETSPTKEFQKLTGISYVW
jgi:hypothetical protein